MFKIFTEVVVPSLLCAAAFAQSTTGPQFLPRGVIQHDNSVITVTANHPQPLFQAITAVREECGWKVNWEEAPGYSHFDTVDDTSPRWRAGHPNAKGVTPPAGGIFVSTLPELNVTDPSAERDVLAKLVEDYNATDNPGKYVLRTGMNGEFTVVGTNVRSETGSLEDVVPLLDLPVTFAKESRSLGETVDAILNALSAGIGK